MVSFALVLFLGDFKMRRQESDQFSFSFLFSL